MELLKKMDLSKGGSTTAISAVEALTSEPDLLDDSSVHAALDVLTNSTVVDIPPKVAVNAVSSLSNILTANKMNESAEVEGKKEKSEKKHTSKKIMRAAESILDSVDVGKEPFVVSTPLVKAKKQILSSEGVKSSDNVGFRMLSLGTKDPSGKKSPSKKKIKKSGKKPRPEIKPTASSSVPKGVAASVASFAVNTYSWNEDLEGKAAGGTASLTIKKGREH